MEDWKIKKIHSGGGLCLHSIKEIWIDRKHWNLPFLLHEVAHALLLQEHWHDWVWGNKYTMLCEKYLTIKEQKKFWKRHRKARFWLDKIRNKKEDTRRVRLDKEFLKTGGLV